MLFAVALHAQKASRSPARDSTFVLSTNDPSRAPSPFIGNGRFGLVVPALGIGATSSIVAGLYEHGAMDVPRIVSAPAWNVIDVYDGERWLTATPPAAGALGSYQQVIDMRTGMAQTSYDWIDGSTRTSVRAETFISRANPLLAGTRLAITAHSKGQLRVRFALVGWPEPHRLPLDTLTHVDPHWGPAELWYPGHMIVRSAAAEHAVGNARLQLTATPDGRPTILAEVATISWPRELAGASAHVTALGDTAMVEVAFNALPGSTYTFSELVSLAWTAESPQPIARAARNALEAGALGYDAAVADNAVAWQHRWATDIQIDGDPELQRVIHSMMFYLLCSADSGTGLAIPPMGLSSAGYYGHVFWDSDTWMFPALVLTHQDVSRSLVDFRWRTLDAARANARANGFRGAMYPWEADDLGHETTPHFAAQNAHSEIHVNGDVAIAQWQYYLASGDSVWLARTGFPVISETANFWVSRATYDSTRDRYHINNVVSVAEGLVGVNDDAYTNAVARRNLEIATVASRKLGVRADPNWAKVAAKLHMPLDSATQSFRTYEGAPDSTLGDVTPMLSYPLGLAMSDRAKRMHLGQALKNIKEEASQGAMMGVTLLSVNAAELGDRATVDSLLPYSYRAHLKGPFLMLSETPTNDAVNFLTGAGGFLQQVIFGYTGLRLGDGGLEPRFPPVLPSHIKRLVLRDLHVRGKRYDVVVDAAGRRVTPHTDRAH
jgi:trehalose/maltose hydrolase-like predicted phosphorylase